MVETVLRNAQHFLTDRLRHQGGPTAVQAVDGEGHTSHRKFR